LPNVFLKCKGTKKRVKTTFFLFIPQNIIKKKIIFAKKTAYAL